jgi:hypothetical protein
MSENQEPRPIYELFSISKEGSDLTFLGPTQKCACGSSLFHAIVWYDPDDEDTKAIAGYFTEMKCVSCGALIRGSTDDPTERAGV